MKPALIDQLRDTVRHQPTRLGQLHAQVRDAGITWSSEQLRFLFETYDGSKVADPASTDPEISVGQVTPEESLFPAVRQLLSAEPGRPVPVARLSELLPTSLPTAAA